MGQQKYYDTVSEATSDLAKRGYTTDFKIHIEEECLICNKSSTQLSPDEFEIDEVHRFEGETERCSNQCLWGVC